MAYHGSKIIEDRDRLKPTVEASQDLINGCRSRIDKLLPDIEAKKMSLANQQEIHEQADLKFMAARHEYEQVTKATEQAERALEQAEKLLKEEQRALGRYQAQNHHAHRIGWTDAEKKEVDVDRAKRGTMGEGQ